MWPWKRRFLPSSKTVIQNPANVVGDHEVRELNLASERYIHDGYSVARRKSVDPSTCGPRAINDTGPIATVACTDN